MRTLALLSSLLCSPLIAQEPTTLSGWYPTNAYHQALVAIWFAELEGTGYQGSLYPPTQYRPHPYPGMPDERHEGPFLIGRHALEWANAYGWSLVAGFTLDDCREPYVSMVVMFAILKDSEHCVEQYVRRYAVANREDPNDLWDRARRYVLPIKSHGLALVK